jgi:hypothetical protein
MVGRESIRLRLIGLVLVSEIVLGACAGPALTPAGTEPPPWE